MQNREQNKTNQLRCPDALSNRVWNDEWRCEDDRIRVKLVTDNVIGGKIIDLGCADGIMCIELARKGKQVIGVDMNPGTIQKAKDLLSKETYQVSRNVQLVCADIEDIILNGKRADTIICCETLEHVFSPNEIFKTMRMIGRAGTKIIITVPNRNVKKGYMARWELAGIHIREFNKDNLTELMSKYCKDIKFYSMYQEAQDDECPFLIVEGGLL